VITTHHEHQDISQFTSPSHEDQQAQRLTQRENAKRLMRESGLGEMLQGLNKNQLKGRGRFEEYDATLMLRWGTGYTLRHIWIDLVDDTIRFRLLPHLRCRSSAPSCDGEYHTLTRGMWSDRAFLQAELQRYYDKPVAESSSD
jgi:hypothetical protein